LLEQVQAQGCVSLKNVSLDHSAQN